jgi:hypothetical protein
MKRIPLLILSLGLLASCSTLIKGETQEVLVTTPGARDAECVLNNGEMNYVAYPPETIIISHRPHDLTVSCKASGNRYRQIVFSKKFSDTEKLNILNGIVPGTMVDYGSGALYEYPKTVVVDFTGTPPHAYPQPSYQKDYEENPGMAGVEEFRPGWPSLMRDQYEPVHTMQKYPAGENGQDVDLGLGGPPASEPAPQNGHAATVTQDTSGVPDLIRDGKGFVGGTNPGPDDGNK